MWKWIYVSKSFTHECFCSSQRHSEKAHESRSVSGLHIPLLYIQWYKEILVYTIITMKAAQFEMSSSIYSDINCCVFIVIKAKDVDDVVVLDIFILLLQLYTQLNQIMKQQFPRRSFTHVCETPWVVSAFTWCYGLGHGGVQFSTCDFLSMLANRNAAAIWLFLPWLMKELIWQV